MTDTLRTTPLHALHVSQGARMVPFAGYEMPVQYPTGVMAEHAHTRDQAGLFDVSHMGQVTLHGPDAALALEALVPVALAELRAGRQRYAMLTDPQGGILDDFMVANRGDHLFAVLNAARKDADIAHLRAHLPGLEVRLHDDRALLALQGPAAEAALAALVPDAAALRFMDIAKLGWDGHALWVARSGYTGEDGFEISVPAAAAPAFAQALLAQDAVAPAGLGARDSLRLEAGLCLYGNDIDTTTTPVEAGLGWAIQKARRAGGARAGGFPGADRILAQLRDGPARCRVGLRPEGRAPIRAGTPLFTDADAPAPAGQVTSGGYGPSLGAPVAMGYVPATHAAPDTPLWAELRGTRRPVRVAALPFRPPTYRK